MRELHQAAGPDRPDRPAQRDFPAARDLEVRGNLSTSYLRQWPCADQLRDWINSKTDWPTPDHLDREEMAR